MPDYDAETCRLVADSESWVARCEADWLAAKEQTRACKETYDEAVAGLRTLIRQRKAGVQELPLSDPEDEPSGRLNR